MIIRKVILKILMKFTFLADKSSHDIAKVFRFNKGKVLVVLLVSTRWKIIILIIFNVLCTSEIHYSERMLSEIFLMTE